MRIRIAVQFEPKTISVNYNYGISTAIKRWLKLGTPQFAEFIENSGYNLDPKKFELFTFSLKFEKMKMSGPLIQLVSPKAYIHISFPILQDYLDFDQLAATVKKDHKLKIEGQEIKIKGLKLDFVPETSFTSEMRFIFMSPMVLSTFRFINQKERVYFLRPEDNYEMDTFLRDNLADKYKIISQNERYQPGPIHIVWDKDYQSRHPRITKKLCIEKPKAKPVDVIGILSPCTIIGDPNLIRTGFIAGFGEKTWLGLGMADHLYDTSYHDTTL
ncbi:MAG: CRISPR-associated endoribonuclease Cas6 [Ignavibacteriales bacterium]|nr:MAG: CRISPR-associated endoribonuclease Cas6 [Ignavibacteriaceae bacterium]MBW7873135.1 CRISPR-associated endoribonuclease Cas6 [Ignavibacteria bacterium]MCZ2142777.1 CRISPR-associated endoribonuclease Cas6 [Ignavibacteriales bacterium]OQY75796.1 MAG: CRISPR-associated endoribonuclease Cas6 [Ignavibacteriales bacterium UTCHB3]MBV6443871.1 hypothetical protein [Ignavibacteriaceae bacterium]